MLTLQAQEANRKVEKKSMYLFHSIFLHILHCVRSTMERCLFFSEHTFPHLYLEARSTQLDTSTCTS